MKLKLDPEIKSEAHPYCSGIMWVTFRTPNGASVTYCLYSHRQLGPAPRVSGDVVHHPSHPHTPAHSFKKGVYHRTSIFKAFVLQNPNFLIFKHLTIVSPSEVSSPRSSTWKKTHGQLPSSDNLLSLCFWARVSVCGSSFMFFVSFLIFMVLLLFLINLPKYQWFQSLLARCSCVIRHCVFSDIRSFF